MSFSAHFQPARDPVFIVLKPSCPVKPPVQQPQNSINNMYIIILHISSHIHFLCSYAERMQR